VNKDYQSNVTELNWTQLIWTDTV